MDLSQIINNPFSNRWLDITPVGRIVTRYCPRLMHEGGVLISVIRCTQDTMAIDERVSELGLFFVFLTLSCITTYGASILMVGFYALIPGFIIFVLGGALGLVYLRCQVSVKREMRFVVHYIKLSTFF